MAASYRSDSRSLPQRSAFVAAFLSFIFPGLGHAYAGAWTRAIAFAAAPLIGLSLLFGVYLHYGAIGFGIWLNQTSVLGPFIVLNIVILGYRALATVDAYRITQYANAYATAARGLGRPRLQADPISLIGLGAILLVMLGGHIVLGKWDLKFYNLQKDIHEIVVVPDVTPDPSATAGPTPTYPPQVTVPPPPTTAPWTGKGPLNILVVGVDQRPKENTFNTDTLIVVSLDPVTHNVSMFSIPRDTTGIPLPPNSGLSYLFGSNYNLKINSLWLNTDRHRDLFPGGGAQAVKQALGYLYGINIQYYVMVNFQGFRQVVDTMGGVTIDVENPVVDDQYPGDNGHLRVYIPAGIQHMTGAQALIYARSRHGSNDFDRALRQQRVLTSLEQQANLDVITSRLSDLIDELGQTVHTDIPEGPDVLLPLIDQARFVKASNIKSYVFDPPTYGIEHNDPTLYWIQPKVPQIRAAVRDALSGGGTDQNQLKAAVTEQAPIVVENGSGLSGQATAVAQYLQGLGLNGQASTDRPAIIGGTMQLLIVNGADTKFPATMALIRSQLGLTGAISTDPSQPVQAITDPSKPVEFIIITGTNTPNLTAPPG